MSLPYSKIPLKLILNFSAFTGMSPYYNFETKQLICKNCCKIYSSVLCIVFLTAPFFTVFYQTFSEEVAYFTKYLMISSLSSTSIAVAIFNGFAVFQGRSWEKLFYHIKKAEETKLNYNKEQTKVSKRISIFFPLLVFLIFTFVDTVASWSKFAIPALIIGTTRVMFVVMLCLAWETSYIFNKNLQQINNCFKIYSFKTSFLLPKNNKNNFDKNIKQIRKKYQYINQAIKVYNKIFGIFYLLFTFCGTFNILLCMDLLISTLKKDVIDTESVFQSAGIIIIGFVSSNPMLNKKQTIII